MEIQDCKVRVSNVDSQESYDNIVVQVIGEMSLKAAPHRKFTQTFVLAQQPNGYFVLNDIFRYLIEEDEEEYPEEAAAEPGLTPEQPVGAESTTVATSEDTAEQQHDTTQVDEKLEEEVPTAPAAPAEEILPNGVSQTSDVAVAEDAPAAAVASQDIEAGRAEEPAAEASTATDDLQTEKPKDSDPTPIASPPKPTEATPGPPSVPNQPPKPAAPRTWATLVASNSQSSTPNTSSPAPSASQQQAPSQSKSALSTQSSSSPTTSPSESRKPPQTNGNAGWQTQEGVKRQGRHQSMSGNMPGDRNTVLGYVKNVNEKVDASLLKQALSSFGELAYFDVSRQKVTFLNQTLLSRSMHAI